MRDNYQNSENDNGDDEDEFKRHHNSIRRAPLGLEQKIAVSVLLIFAIAVIGMWMIQFKKSITGPFNYTDNNTNNNAEANRETFLQKQEQNSEEALRSKDTDGDGLSDWDELYVYKTSPYLEDSDSDGFSDKEEIDSGNDPNCPVGRNCYAANTIQTDQSPMDNTNISNTNSLNLLNNQNKNPLNNLSNQPATDNKNIQTNGGVDLKSILGDKLNAATLRQMLLKAGMNQKILDQISDDDLLKSYQETLNKQQ